MTVWAVADIHASRTNPETGLPQKPMDVFGPQWVDHVARLETAWNGRVRDGDTVIVVGDIDWALHLEDALPTLQRIAGWKGTKLLVRGNHDYWWSSKTTGRVRKSLPPGMHLIHNDACLADGFNICGTKGAPVPGSPDWTAENEKLLNREVQRLQMSLDKRRPGLPTIAAIHYPPFYPSSGESPFSRMLQAAGVSHVVYGHLHGSAAAAGPHGAYNGIEYALVAGDALDFQPMPLTGVSVPQSGADGVPEMAAPVARDAGEEWHE